VKRSVESQIRHWRDRGGDGNRKSLWANFSAFLEKEADAWFAA